MPSLLLVCHGVATRLHFISIPKLAAEILKTIGKDRRADFCHQVAEIIKIMDRCQPYA